MVIHGPYKNVMRYKMSWNIHTLPVKGFAANCYWIENEEEAWLIDPSAKPPEDYIDKPFPFIYTRMMLKG
jgi:hypothetical protein